MSELIKVDYDNDRITVMARALLMADKNINHLKLENKKHEKKIKQLKPKAEFYDIAMEAKESVEWDQVAKIFEIRGFGRNKLLKYLREKSILQPNNVPCQSYTNRGYFRVSEKVFIDLFGISHTNVKVSVYQKGIDYIRKLLKKDGLFN